MAYVDPWTGFREGVQTLGDFSKEQEQRKLQEMQLAKSQMELDELKRAKETREGLGKIWEKKSETEAVANPEFEKYQETVDFANRIAGLQSKYNPSTTAAAPSEGDVVARHGLASYTSVPQATIQKPKYSDYDLYNQSTDYLLSRGAYGELERLGKAMDITDKVIAAGTMPEITAVQKAANAWLALDNDEEQVKSNLKMQFPNSAEIIDKTSFKKNQSIVDAGDGRKFVVALDPDGKQRVYQIPQQTMTKEMKEKELSLREKKYQLEEQNLENSRERVKQGWARLNPELRAKLESAGMAGKEFTQETIKGADDYYTAVDSNKVLDSAENMLNTDPRQIAGWGAKLKASIGKIDPALEEALHAGDKNEFSRLMMVHADVFKKLLGPQISNSDATLMFQLTGATASSPAEIRAAIRTIRERNARTISRYESSANAITGAIPEVSPFIPETVSERAKRESKSQPKVMTTRPPDKSGYKIQKHSKTGEYRYVPITGDTIPSH